MKLRRVTAWGLVFTMMLSLDVSGVTAADSESVPGKEEQIRIATEERKLPGTDRTFFDENDDIRDYFNISGYVSENVQDRSEYYEEYVKKGKKNTENYVVVEEDGYWKNGTTDYITEEEYAKLGSSEQAGYTFVTAERQFAAALDAEPRVIQVNAEELELGCYAVSKSGGVCSKISGVTDYAKGKMPITNPEIMSANTDLPAPIKNFVGEIDGTGLSDLSLYSHLTIFSTTGCIIRHAGMDVGGCEDVIIRNFKFEGMYEWDDEIGTTHERLEETRKRYGWCNLSLNDSDNIWVDHCTFGFAFDGNLDLKNGSSASVTWCKFGVQDLDTAGEENYAELPKWNESKGCELWRNILYMEEYYQAYLAGETNGYFYKDYTKYRKEGATPKDIFTYAAMHSKVHLVGSGEDSFYTNVEEKITLGFNFYTNIIQRVPMVRSGNGHMYNCIVDNADYQANSAAMVAKGVNSTGYRSYNSINNARNAATIGTDTCIFKEVTPCCGAETQGQDTANLKDTTWVKILNNFVNRNLVVNSRVTVGSRSVDRGSSWDNNGYNLFNDSYSSNPHWKWKDKSSIGDFRWAKWKDLSEFYGTDASGNYYSYVTDTLIKSWATNNGFQNFYNKYYEGQYKLEYAYKCFDLDDVEEMLKKYGGARENLYTIDGGDETPLDYIQPINSQTAEKKKYAKKVTFNVNGADITKEGNTTYLKEGESITLPTEEEMTKEGYHLLGWKKGSYSDSGELVLDADFQTPDKDGKVTIAAGKDKYTEENYYAVWEINTYTITFNSMGGSEIEPITMEHFQKIEDLKKAGKFPADPKKKGFTFAGWYRRYNADTDKYTSEVKDTTQCTGAMTLYAKWEAENPNPGPDPGPDPEPTNALGNVNGDVDGDGNPNINSQDALAVLQYSVGLIEPGEGFDISVANVNGDEDADGNPIINSQDALEILQYSVGLIDKFSAEETEE